MVVNVGKINNIQFKNKINTNFSFSNLYFLYRRVKKINDYESVNLSDFMVFINKGGYSLCREEVLISSYKQRCLQMNIYCIINYDAIKN